MKGLEFLLSNGDIGLVFHLLLLLLSAKQGGIFKEKGGK